MNTIFDELTQKTADFVRFKLTDAIAKANIDPNNDSFDGCRAVSAFLLEWVDLHKHYRWPEQITHQKLWTQVRGNSSVWNFVFGDLQGFITSVSTSNNYSESDSLVKGVDFVRIVQSYYRNSPTITYRPFPKAVESDEDFLLGRQECDLMGFSDDYISSVFANQSWVFVFLFAIECFNLHYSVMDLVTSVPPTPSV